MVAPESASIRVISTDFPLALIPDSLGSWIPLLLSSINTVEPILIHGLSLMTCSAVVTLPLQSVAVHVLVVKNPSTVSSKVRSTFPKQLSSTVGSLNTGSVLHSCSPSAPTPKIVGGVTSSTIIVWNTSIKLPAQSSTL